MPTPAPKTTPIFDASAAPSDVTRAELAPEPGSADAKTIDAGITDTIAAQAYDSVVYALGPAKSGIRTSPWTLCPNYLPPDQVKAIVDQPQDPDAPLDIHADNSQTFQQQLSVFTGNVSLQQDKRKLHADTLRYDMETDRAEAAGNLFIEDRGWKIWADRGTWDFAANQGQLDNAHFEYLGNHSRGTASSADFEGTKVSHFTDATYTNCPAGIDDWALKAKHLTLDRPADTGTARHATFSFKGVPILYTPYLSFPLSDKRKTGLLTPIVGYNSNDGLDVTVPFYWNIAPNYDATIAARYMNDRGIQGQGEFRYLFPSGKQRGSIAGEYLPNDSSYQDDDRWAVSFKHEGELAPNLSTDISLASASDKDYFNDLGNSLHVASTPNLERRIDLTYQTRDWRFRTRVQEYQILDKDLSSADKPYERKPQFLFDTKRPLRAGPVELDMRAQMDNFDHSDKNAKDTGSRVDLEPGISLPTVGLAGFFTPRVALRHTKYYLEEAGSGHDKTHPSRTLPVASIDSGLFFEKDLNWGGHAMVHSIEPRLYYLYIPNKNQDDIPRFDTIEPDFSATQLFQDNRFTGGDRIGDANQLTTAVTTRLLDSESGRQRLAVSLGQIRYFRDRKVTLNPGEKANDDSSSDIVFGLNALPYGHWSLTSNWLWDPHKKQTTTHHSRLFYKRDRDHILNFSYRFRRDGNNTFDDGNKNRDDDLEQTDISGIWRLASNWKAVGRWNWSISDKKTLEVLGGLQYDSCCWNLLMVYREFVQNNDGDTQQGVYLQFTLKGLTRVGHNVDKLLARGILGYEPEDIK